MDEISVLNLFLEAGLVVKIVMTLLFVTSILSWIVIIERYNFLRNLHPYTKNYKLKCVNNFEDLIFEINKEKKIFKDFMKNDYDNYRWYPKASWIVDKLSQKLDEI